MDRFTGGCLCGNVRIVASGLPYRVGPCHCLDCRKHHGALFHVSAVFPQNAVTIDGETRDYAGRFFCPRCDSSIFARSADEIEVNLGSLDAPDQLMPTEHVDAPLKGLIVIEDAGHFALVTHQEAFLSALLETTRTVASEAGGR